MGTNTVNSGEQLDRQSRILEAALDLLSRHGISGVSMRSVAREAGVALGLVNYYYDDKTSLIRAALHRVDEHDLLLVTPDPDSTPDEQLRTALRRVAGADLLTTKYLSLRLHLWALAQADEGYAEINAAAFDRYIDGLATLVSNARPGLSWEECRERGSDIVVIQNGMWLTSLLGVDKASIKRSIQRTEDIAFAPVPDAG
ncbi:transcriptional regulator, TetR family [Pseudarthrobacter chlorophenolicus A6]|uniref:Transcriptional regulator, TetR family n=1 Tax=Pseudarthrobacter chlorophenolicus (strain ATCC 700700 / DSM 12829 / CIP 107037 / JCM 12360 / KCTC 9906 / NCIMB 13794 / A6) TaxID=452863 RepID=B8H738_PSECP|nr:TetR/AcrR family transcriptional regulator [Pseudarthrobacter chlorophenolicus]ACL41640.1 transcriptional regulator, TetR family [Pseudarthrobacter chlorophenolicus A6]SDQ60790.1 DNA-binding transcriptional regulator, AcrR family [Pseudarthrobacter chlorophenolicus]